MITLQFLPYGEIESLSSAQRITKLLELIQQDKVVLLQGRLKPDEEAKLIQETMELISDNFKGMELCTIYPEEKNLQFFKKMRRGMTKFLLGNREGITIIGPSSVVKDIKRDPNKIELFTVAPSLAKSGKTSAKKKRGK
ncbi:MAG: DUF2073 domain-containing protein [Candidatus Nanoarchaeia archaeon]|nr:DUF2073 domain-containing protein [Candidatus Nanoarchaeia archaeon]